MRSLDTVLGRQSMLLSDADFGKALDESAAAYVSSGKSLMDAIEAYKKVDLNSTELGFVSARFESGNAGPGTISNGKGDFGGKSYGTYQFSSRTGSLQDFLKISGYESQFSDPIGSPGFDQRWRELARNDPNFGEAQHKVIVATHFQPQMDKLASGGIDLSDRGRMVDEAVFSTSTQYGPRSSVIGQALAGHNVSELSDLQIVTLIQDYKASRVRSHFASSSPAVQASVARRIQNEKAVLQALA